MNVYELHGAVIHTMNHEAGLRQSLLMELCRMASSKENETTELRDIIARMVTANRKNKAFLKRYLEEGKADDIEYRGLLEKMAA